MTTESANSLPKMLPGVVCVQWKRCGRKRCKCAAGPLHGPYYYRFWRDSGRLRKQYVPRAERENVQARCNARRTAGKQLRDAMTAWRRMMADLRKVQDHDRAAIR